MVILTRRMALALAGTVATAALIGKSLAEESLADISTMTLVVPPVPAPALVLHDADGRAHKLAEFIGRGVVLNLWATWCAPCVAEMPALDELAARVKAHGIEVLPLSSDRGGAASVRAFYASHGIDALPIWLDPGGEVLQALHVEGIPTTLIIDRAGRIAGRLEGPINWAAPDAAPTLARLVAG